MRTILILTLTLLGTTIGAETGSDLKTKGIDALRAAQADPDQIVVAARFLSQAADALIADGKDAEAEEVNACLFWAKKKMTIQQIDMFLAKGNGVAKAAVAKMEAVEKTEVKPEDGKAWLAKVDGYAETQKDGFLVAVRYFEVASRFKGTPEGEQALEKSLKFLQQAKVAQPADKVVGAAEKGDGKVYVQSVPVGATILVRQNNELRDTGAKTPSLVQLPKGPATLVLRKEKYEDSVVEVTSGDAIVKTDVVKLEMPKFDVEVTVSPEMGDGWSVFVNGKPMMDNAGNPAVAPCTVRLANGTFLIGLAKDGFRDPQTVKVVVNESGSTMVVKGTPVQGQSRLICTAKPEIPSSPIVIQANKKVGFMIGSIPAGSSLVFQYVDGVWKGWGMAATENPDSPKQERGETCRLALFEKVNGKEILVSVIPAGTKNKPFVFNSPRRLTEAYVRINDGDGQFANNPGNVRYSIFIR